jgi:hypothetical protein
MNMTESGGALSVPAEHLPGLVTLVAVPIVLGVVLFAVRALARRDIGWAEAVVVQLNRLSFSARVVLVATFVGAVVHGALVPTHWSEDRTVALLFIADAVGFGVAFVWTFMPRRYWNVIALATLAGTTATYAWYLLSGRETPDLVGILTTTVELAGALVILAAAFWKVKSPKGAMRWTAAAVGVSLVSMLATSAVAGASLTGSTDIASTRPQAAGASAGNGMTGMAGMSGSSAKSTPLSLATTSPAGPITWPDDMSTMAAGMRMATPDCTAQPTKAQQQASVDLVNQTVAAVAPFSSLAAAKAAGYVPVTPSGRKVVHYINPSIYRQRPTVDPHHVPVLVYVNTAHGAVLSAAMYLMPQSSTAATPPQPGGCLTQWHIHTDLCFNGANVVGNNEAGSCAAGSSNRTTSPMMHVWLTPVSGGPLAPDPPARDEVAAATRLPMLNPANGVA